MSKTKDQLDLGEPKVEAICDELDLPEEVTHAAREQAQRVDLDSPINRSGKVVAASSVYFQCCMYSQKRTQEQVSQAAGVSVLPIRQCYQEIAEFEGIPIRRQSREREQVEAESPHGTLVKLKEWFRA